MGSEMRCATLVLLLALCGGLVQAADGAQRALPSAELVVEKADGTSVGYTVELALDDAARRRGLMERRALAPDAGMLFDFGAERPLAMWMRNTYIALDMLFADADGAIVDLIERTTPLSDALLMPRAPARYVLELPAGQAAAHGFAVGDRLRLPADVRTSP